MHLEELSGRVRNLERNVSGGGVGVPTLIATGDTYEVPENWQVLYNEPITVDGTLTVNGMLIFVN